MTLETQHLRIPLWSSTQTLFFPVKMSCSARRSTPHRLTVLERWEPSANCFRDTPGVRRVICEDVRNVDGLGLEDEFYHYAFWWHGPEHLPFEDVGRTLAQLERLAKFVIVGCPWGVSPQEAKGGNPYQEHLSSLYPGDFRRWGYRVLQVGQRDGGHGNYLMAWKWEGMPLPRTLGVVIAFNEGDMLAGCLESIEGQVDRIVVVDGAYAHFPHESPESTDDTRAIAEAYGAEWIPCPDGQAWPTQVDKRTAYLVGEEGDWYLHIDADERLQGVLPLPRPGEHYAFRIMTRACYESWVGRDLQMPSGTSQFGTAGKVV